MRNESTLPAAKVDELAQLLQTGCFEEFMRLFKLNTRELQDESEASEAPVELAELVNKALVLKNPETDMKLVVSQRTAEQKHLIMIMDNSRFWGDSFTITRQMFTV
ncbi:MAG: hypothetical protein SGJ27_12155 [Candidatus Melainabacteria bacterium]|nr:hypothetical protein [Candidatus Melainabacteria bacterium]